MVIGLPIIMIIWPFSRFMTTCVSLMGWFMDGKYYKWDGLPESPYQFIKKVWK